MKKQTKRLPRKKTELTKNYLKKHIKRNKYLLLSTLQEVLLLNNTKIQTILNRIIKDFWRGLINLICLPSESTLIKTSPNILINGSSNCDPLILTRETLRNLIQNEIQGKKRTQERIDLISEQLEYIDGEDSSYKTFINEDWEFYQRIINRLNRRYEEFCNQSKKHKDWRLLHFQKIIGRFIRIHCSQW